MARAGKKAASGKKKQRPSSKTLRKAKAARKPLKKTVPAARAGPSKKKHARKPQTSKKARPKKPPKMRAKKIPKRPAPRKAAKTGPKKPARKAARRARQPAARIRAPAPAPEPSSAERQLIVIEGKKPLMVAPPPTLPSTAMPAAPPAAAKPLVPEVRKPAPAAPPAAPPQPQPQAPPHIDASGPSDGPLAIALTPALDMLPEWEDRLRLKRAIFEDGLSFYSLGRHCPEFHEASSLLAQSAKPAMDDVPGYFMVCVKDRNGKMVGAMDGHMLENGVMSVGRSAVNDDKRRELHILLYSAALCGHQPAYVVSAVRKAPLSVGSAGALILLGRGFGFSAVPTQAPDWILLIRRVKHELDPISSGQEIASALGAAKDVLAKGLGPAIEEIAKRGAMPLVPLPASPDSREHLHELCDAVTMLGVEGEGIEAVIENLRVDYVLGRKDIAPALLS